MIERGGMPSIYPNDSLLFAWMRSRFHLVIRTGLNYMLRHDRPEKFSRGKMFGRLMDSRAMEQKEQR